MKPGAMTRKLARLPIARANASAGAVPTRASADVLAALKEQMARLLVREPAAEKIPSDTVVEATESEADQTKISCDFAVLPVAQVETESGVVWRKLWRVPLEYRVGVATCHDARSVNWTQVSLLALTPELVTTNPEELLFLDTETTGLGGAGVVAFLVGLAFFEQGEFWVEQILLEGPEHEPALLAHLQSRLATRPVVVSFNGKTFDWPLLVSRYAMHRLAAPKSPRHLDLLHVARRLHKTRLGSCTLRALEIQVLGFERLGDIDGMEVAARYLHYLRSGDASGLEAVLEHNFWDVLSMLALVGLYGASDLSLAATDLAQAARTLARAKAFPEALSRADQAVASLSLGSAGEQELARVHLVRGEIRKTLGDRSGAIDDFTAAQTDPKARLELAKLFEHFLKDPEGAMRWAEQGTGERPEAVHRRLTRLGGKHARPRANSRRRT